MDSRSRSEREIMDLIFSKGVATVNDVMAEMTPPPCRAALRTMLKILEKKGCLAHTKSGRSFVCSPVTNKALAGRSAFQKVLQTSFGGSLEKAVASYITDPKETPSEDELKRLTELIKETQNTTDNN